MTLDSGHHFSEKSLPAVRLEPVDASTQLVLDKNHITDADHATNNSSGLVSLTEGSAGSGVVLEDSSVRDAEIAKASLLDKSAQSVDLQQSSHTEAVLLAPMQQVRTKQAIVNQPIVHAISDFDITAWSLAAQANPLLDLVQGARKTMSTSAWYTALLEQKWIKASSRIEELKSKNKWSLRQHTKERLPPRTKAHWDFLLDEMKWLRTDFREERKWKIALARKTAYAVKDWHDASDRSSLEIRTRSPAFLSRSEDIDMRDVSVEYEPPTPPSGSDDINIACVTKSHSTSAPSNQVDNVMVHSPPMSAVDDSMHVFEMSQDEVYAYLGDLTGRSSPSLVPDMPIYGPPLPEDNLCEEAYNVTPLISISNYTQNEVRITPSIKRNRTEYEAENSNVELDQDPPTASQHSRRKSTIPTLAIRPPFIPHNIDRRTIDRKDHQITWTSEADEMLLNLLSEYQYNWDFVAQAMTPSTLVCAIADRKSAWDCFERWVQIDPRSSDVVFTGAHARLVQNRVDDMVRSPRHLEKLGHRKNASTMKVQSHDLKKQRQFSLFDAMRKVQRKRENQPKTAPAKKAVADSTKTPPVVPTPQHLSQMKFERDQQIARAFLESKNQQMQALQQQRLLQQQQQKGGPAPTQAQIAQIQAARQTQQRAQMAQQAAQANGGNGGLLPPGVNTNGIPTARHTNGIARPSLVGQLPPRPLSATAGGMPATNIQNGHGPNPALLRIPPGQRLSQEQMNQLLAQARLQKGMTASPSPAMQTNGQIVTGPSPNLIGNIGNSMPSTPVSHNAALNGQTKSKQTPLASQGTPTQQTHLKNGLVSAQPKQPMPTQSQTTAPNQANTTPKPVGNTQSQQVASATAGTAKTQQQIPSSQAPQKASPAPATTTPQQPITPLLKGLPSEKAH